MDGNNFGLALIFSTEGDILFFFLQDDKIRLANETLTSSFSRVFFFSLTPSLRQSQLFPFPFSIYFTAPRIRDRERDSQMKNVHDLSSDGKRLFPRLPPLGRREGADEFQNKNQTGRRQGGRGDVTHPGSLRFVLGTHTSSFHA